MIRRITVEGLGPHESLDLTFDDPMGETRLRGSSEVGKSTLMDAVCFVLWGHDRTGRPLNLLEVRSDAPAARVELVLVNGSVAERVLNRSKDGGRGKTTRSWQGQPYTTEKAFLTALGPLGRNLPALRQVLIPMAWRALVQGQGGGRPFRDVLASILPKADKGEIVANTMRESGHEMHRGDPLHEGDAKELRTRANRSRDKAIGDVTRLRALVDAAGLDAGPPEATGTQVARDVIDRADAWDRFDGFAEAEERAAKAAELAIEWDDRKAALGDRPSTTGDAIEAARQKAHEAEQREKRTRIKLVGAEAAMREARTRSGALVEPQHPALRFADAVNEAREELNAAIVALNSADDTCPTCAQQWDGARAEAKQRADRARGAVADAEVDRAEEAERLQELFASSKDAAAASIEHASHVLSESERTHARAEAALAEAREEAAAAAALNAPGVAWDRATRALGPRPSVPAPAEVPSPPAHARPEAADVEAAKKTIADADRNAGAQEQRAADLERLRETLEASQSGLADLEAECERLDALVDAVRRAPSEAARRQLGALGDLGPVVLDLRIDGGVDVLIDGRPWWLASTGRQLVGDVYLRAGLRRAVGLAWLPLFIDCVQDVAGQEIPSAAPCVLLETVAGPLEIVR